MAGTKRQLAARGDAWLPQRGRKLVMFKTNIVCLLWSQSVDLLVNFPLEQLHNLFVTGVYQILLSSTRQSIKSIIFTVALEEKWITKVSLTHPLGIINVCAESYGN